MEIPTVTILIFAGVALFLSVILRPRKRSARRMFTRQGSDNVTGFEASKQLDHIAKVRFETQPILNEPEKRVFAELEAIMAEMDQGYRVMAQTSMGEVLRPVSSSADWSDRKRAYGAINSKRFDFAIVDSAGMLAMAVEYQGGGHHQKKAFIRDAVKREVCRRAGVPFVEVEKGMKPAALRARVREVLGGSVEPSGQGRLGLDRAMNGRTSPALRVAR